MNKDKARDPARDALAEIVDGEQAHLPFHLRCQIMVRAARWADAAVAEARAPLVALLRLIEWQAGDDPRDGLRCPICCRWKHEGGHAPDCQLAAALAKGETG